DDVFETMIQLYKQERIGTIWAMVRHMGPNGLQTEVDATGYAEFQRVVVDDRNIKMAAESIKLMEKSSTFIAVGALHLPGEKGILSILAQKGFIITRK
ncbi:MAG: TraB/GumN family protein, partial [Rhizobiaceae bacterium]